MAPILCTTATDYCMHVLSLLLACFVENQNQNQPLSVQGAIRPELWGAAQLLRDRLRVPRTRARRTIKFFSNTNHSGWLKRGEKLGRHLRLPQRGRSNAKTRHAATSVLPSRECTNQHLGKWRQHKLEPTEQKNELCEVEELVRCGRHGMHSVAPPPA